MTSPLQIPVRVRILSVVTPKQVYTELGVLLAPDKQEGLSTPIVLLGIVIDIVEQELRLPTEKLVCLQAILREWEKQKSCTRKELESFIGVLQHVCRVIKPGRSFLQQAIAQLGITTPQRLQIYLKRAGWKGACI